MTTALSASWELVNYLLGKLAWGGG